MKSLLLVVVASLAIAGCASFTPTIAGTPEGTVAATIKVSPTITTDLQSAAFNFDQAVTVGALDANDPAPKCLHDVLQAAGIEVPAGSAAPASFTPKNDGPASAGAIAYILAQQAKQAKGSFTVPIDCEALLGRVVIDGVTAVTKPLILKP